MDTSVGFTCGVQAGALADKLTALSAGDAAMARFMEKSEDRGLSYPDVQGQLIGLKPTFAFEG
jgi:hypothetical protein